MEEIIISNRKIGPSHKPFVIAEVGINHDGDINKAYRMIDDAYRAGCECVKFQTHIVSDEMIPNDVVPGNARESIWDMMNRCALSEREDMSLKRYVESKGMIFLSTPFSRAASDRLRKMKASAYKIGSGECNNYPLVEHIASFGKPIILSTGMNDVMSIKKSVSIFKKYKVPFALLHCTSIYPTPYSKVRLGALSEIKKNFPNVVLGLSDHSVGNYTCFAAISLGASILEKHFTSNKRWRGSDMPISVDTKELKDLIVGTSIIHSALNGSKNILKEEKSTIDFAYACVVSIKDVNKGRTFTKENIWVKRPGTGEIKAEYYNELLGKKAKKDIKKDSQIRWNDIDG